MIIHSIIPSDVIFQNNDGSTTEYLEMEFLGEKVLVSQTENNQYIINRVISTSLKAYLNPQLQPGSMISGIVPRA